MCKMEWMKKIIIIWIGSIIAAYGITLAMYAGFGGATLAVLWQGISKTFHISIGMASMIVAVVMIIFVFFYDRSQLHIGTVLYQIVYSLCVDLFANAHIYSRHMWINVLLMLLGIILFAIGTGLYAAASLGRGSYEALTFSLAGKSCAELTGCNDGYYRCFIGWDIWHMHDRHDPAFRTDHPAYSFKNKSSVSCLST